MCWHPWRFLMYIQPGLLFLISVLPSFSLEKHGRYFSAAFGWAYLRAFIIFNGRHCGYRSRGKIAFDPHSQGISSEVAGNESEREKREEKEKNRQKEKREVGRFARNCSRVVGQKRRPCFPSSGLGWSVGPILRDRLNAPKAAEILIRVVKNSYFSSIFTFLEPHRPDHQYQALLFIKFYFNIVSCTWRCVAKLENRSRK